jgi:beta-carotene hydroxylase
MFQNFHLIHHLFPRVPFYLYSKAFRSLKPVLDKERAHIYEFGHEPAAVLTQSADRSSRGVA